ncbi:MAG: protein-L-isoaspartate(D-aspartate) O-methyltransferase [Gammaproteobacteria bacterium]
MSEPDREKQLARMLEAIREDARCTAGATGRAVFSERVMAAMREVPRDEFVPEELRPYAFENRPLPIGDGQTISQPYIVALMSDLLETEPDQTILEIGTGCGYQAAVLAELVARVYSVEIVENLQRQAEERLRRLGYRNVTTRHGDGYQGWPEHAPFDGIIITAATPEIPPPLIDQLRPGGRLVAPVGPRFGSQNLVVVEKDPEQRISTRNVLPVTFVPLTRMRQDRTT